MLLPVRFIKTVILKVILCVATLWIISMHMQR